MPRKKKQPATRVEELRDQAREMAGHSGDALKEFAESTGAAAKEFAGKARDAAKDLVESIDKASKGVEPQERRGGRRLLKALIAVGAGVAIFANERVREAVGSAVRRTRGSSVPDVWRPEPSRGNGSTSTESSQAKTG